MKAGEGRFTAQQEETNVQGDLAKVRRMSACLSSGTDTGLEEARLAHLEKYHRPLVQGWPFGGLDDLNWY